MLVTPQTVAYQAPLSVRFLRQEYWSVLLFPSPGDLLDPGINPVSCIAGGFFTHCATREALQYCTGLCQRLFPNFKPLIKPGCGRFYSGLKYLLLHHGRQVNFPAMLVADLTMPLTLSFKVGNCMSHATEWAMASRLTLANELERKPVCLS